MSVKRTVAVPNVPAATPSLRARLGVNRIEQLGERPRQSNRPRSTGHLPVIGERSMNLSDAPARTGAHQSHSGASRVTRSFASNNSGQHDIGECERGIADDVHRQAVHVHRQAVYLRDVSGNEPLDLG